MAPRGYPRLPREAAAERSRPRSRTGEGTPCRCTTVITAPQLSRLIGLPKAPAIVDVRIDEDYRADPRLLPGSLRRDYRDDRQLGDGLRGKSVVVVCQKGQKLSEGTAAWLRHDGIDAQTLEGGFEAWKKAGEPLVRTDKLPPRDEQGPHGLGDARAAQGRPHRLSLADPPLRRSQRGVPVRRCRRRSRPSPSASMPRPSTSRACSGAIAARPAPSTRCSRNSGSRSEPLLQLAKIVRGADTARPDLTPQSAGLLAASLGYSRMYRDDLAQLEAAMGFYDAFYRWCRDATDETHNWPSHKPGA